MATWIVRGGSSKADQECACLHTRSVGVYFGVDRHLDGMEDEALRAEIERYYIQDCRERGIKFLPWVVTFFHSQTLAFRNGIQIGDTVIMPRKRSGGHRVARGVVSSECEYWGGEVYPHRRRVDWQEHNVPRESTGLAWRPSDRRTVFRIEEAR